ncbi:MAG: GNAT family N-acetyltransferase, partial [Bacteroidetes bacterium]|nr:GNAT family N-acetyltransferase [Bacteroidota bacterium]
MKNSLGKPEITIRKGIKSDLPVIHQLIVELAIFEREPNAVSNTIERMEREGFGDQPAFEFFVAEVENKVVGLSLYYYRYSTWKGRCL